MFAFILCLSIVVMDAVSILAALPWNWGSAADWFTGGATLAGFVGAILALRVQTKAANLQADDHNTAKTNEEEKERRTLVAKNALAIEERERCARATLLQIRVGRDRSLPGHIPVDKSRLTVTCEVIAPKSFILSNVLLTPPSLPQFFTVQEEFRVQADRLDQMRNLRWVAEGDYWPEAYGGEEDAKAWVEENTSVVFTDPAGVRWYRRGTGELTELN